jgi:hypothetical protein
MSQVSDFAEDVKMTNRPLECFFEMGQNSPVKGGVKTSLKFNYSKTSV